MLLGSCLEPTRAWKYTLVCVLCDCRGPGEGDLAGERADVP